MVETTRLQKLYEQDLVAWCDDTAAKLKAGNFDEIDLDHLIEEIEGLAGRDRRELKSRIRVLLTHLLKRTYVKSPDNYRGWEITIREQRQQLRDLLEQSPSLQNEVTAIFPKCWNEALATVKEDFPGAEFPHEWIFSRDMDALLQEKLW
ncbi:MAG: DUF29 domain-containing protein [Leptolyngbyaceae cyanobacterium SL_5_9]|nr:DUF29 domain-containing protein [Leptolyngbyaceae cyanobacterium SL_5_9]NJO73480.1 DUF29 domain-containing protein [Leptolyngbyaceae cyanobacterium RM1_406_9]